MATGFSPTLGNGPMINTFHFIRPYWLFMFIPVSALLLYHYKNEKHHNAWHRACDAHLLPHLLVNTGAAKQVWALCLLGIAYLLATLALAGPTWSKRSEQVYRTNAAMVILLDLSPALFAMLILTLSLPDALPI